MIKFLRRNKGLSCEEIAEVLQGYLDGVIDEETARKVASHLDDCDTCAPEAILYSRIKDSLAAKELAVDPEVLMSLQAFGERVARGEIDPEGEHEH